MPDNTKQDYKTRSYLSAIEAANFLGMTVKKLHTLTKTSKIKYALSSSGQKRFNIQELKRYEEKVCRKYSCQDQSTEPVKIIYINGTKQKIITENSMHMDELEDSSINLVITSPPYFDTKMYSRDVIENDLGNIHDIDDWFNCIGIVWKEVFRVLQPGRKTFINIMNLPIRTSEGGYKTLNLVGKTIDLCEGIGFIFKRDIIWHKTNAVRAHFGTYPYPGGILINNMHEFILEFDKPAKKSYNKYDHVTKDQKELSKISKDFWISIKKSDVWLMKPQGSGDRRNHIAPYPYELPYRLIKAFSYIGETILDPFLGSGTTLKAASDLGRNGVGYEINAAFSREAIQLLKSRQ